MEYTFGVRDVLLKVLLLFTVELNSNIYPSHGYTALVEDEICKTYQAILAS